jgi:hypothetical protein
MEKESIETIFAIIIGSYALAVFLFMVFTLIKHYKTLPAKLRREKRIDSLIYQIGFFGGWLAGGRNKLNETKFEELDRLKKERENENRDIINSAEQKDKLISDLKNEIEDLKNKKSENEKNEKIENEKLLKIVSEQKNAILDLEMELKIKKSENEKLVY